MRIRIHNPGYATASRPQNSAIIIKSRSKHKLNAKISVFIWQQTIGWQGCRYTQLNKPRTLIHTNLHWWKVIKQNIICTRAPAKMRMNSWARRRIGWRMRYWCTEPQKPGFPKKVKYLFSKKWFFCNILASLLATQNFVTDHNIR